MSARRGVFALDRGVFEHEVFKTKKPLSKLEAWIWLLGDAAWKGRSRIIDGKKIELKRGQISHSIRFLATAWRWSKTKVERFLETLKNEDMIGTETGTGLTVITIKNYNKYQKVSLPKRDTNETKIGTEPGQQRDKLEDKEKSIESTNGAPRAEGPLEADQPSKVLTFPAQNLKQQLFERARGMFDGDGGRIAGQLLKATKDDINVARAALETAASKVDPKGYIYAVIRNHGRDSSGNDERARGRAW